MGPREEFIYPLGANAIGGRGHPSARRFLSRTKVTHDLGRKLQYWIHGILEEHSLIPATIKLLNRSSRG